MHDFIMNLFGPNRHIRNLGNWPLQRHDVVQAKPYSNHRRFNHGGISVKTEVKSVKSKIKRVKNQIRELDGLFRRSNKRRSRKYLCPTR